MGRTIGFTGTQRGLTSLQRGRLVSALFALDPSVVAHGDCIGADDEFHESVQLYLHRDTVIEVWPPENDSKAVGLEGNVRHEPLPYLKRNEAIVRTTDMLIACPDGPDEKLRSGTWATVRMARRHGKPIIIIFPDGSVRTEGEIP